MSARCRDRTCKAEIIWAKTPAGKKLALDREPVTVQESSTKKGPFFMLPDGATDPDHGGPLAVVVSKSDHPRPWYRAHWATCNSPDKFRRQKG